MCKNRSLKQPTKSQLYRAVVLTTLLYGAKSWVSQRCLRSILKIHSTFVTNNDVLDRTGLLSTEAMLLKIQRRWVGQVSWMSDTHLPKITLCGELTTGQRDIGAPRGVRIPRLKKSLKACHIEKRSCSSLAANQIARRSTVHKGEIKPMILTCNCGRCRRTCKSRIGLISTIEAVNNFTRTCNKVYIRLQRAATDVWKYPN